MEKVFLLVFLLTGLNAVTTELCTQYYCNDFMQYMPTQQTRNTDYTYCGQSQQLVRTFDTGDQDKWKIISLKDCPYLDNKKQMCPVQQLTDLQMLTLCRQVPQTTPVTTNLLPGNNCTNGEQCHSGSCAEGVCTGLENNARCSSNAQCDVGYYCGSRRCRPLVALTETCSHNADCVQNAFCYQNQCRTWLSLDDGAQASNLDPRVCKHAYSGSGRCLAPLFRNQTETTTVGGRRVCNYTDSEGYHSTMQKETICGYTSFPASYCPLGHGDPEFTKVLDVAKSFISLAPTDCHTDEALSCQKLKDRLPRQTMAWENIIDWPNIYPKLENNPSCVLNNVNYQWFYLYNGTYPQPS